MLTMIHRTVQMMINLVFYTSQAGFYVVRVPADRLQVRAPNAQFSAQSHDGAAGTSGPALKVTRLII